MTKLSITIDDNMFDYISKRHGNTSEYIQKLIQEDMLLNEINDSKNSGTNYLNSLEELDD